MTSSATETSVEFGATDLLANAKVYADTKTKRLIDAASSFDNVEDAKFALTEAWDMLEDQIERGAGYTPDASLGFGSDNAAVIAETLLGRRNSVGATRKAFVKIGK